MKLCYGAHQSMTRSSLEGLLICSIISSAYFDSLKCSLIRQFDTFIDNYVTSVDLI